MHVENRWSLKTKTINPLVLCLTAIAAVVIITVWLVALFMVYLADDWSSPAADERSIPAVRSY